MDEEIRYTFVPREGSFIVGVPARDLTQEDVDRLGEARLANALASGLYTKAKKGNTPVKAGEDVSK